MNLQQIPSKIKILTLAIFLADASNSAVIPIFPGYAVQLGASMTALGAYGSAAAIAMLVFSLPLGRLSDLHGRKALMTPGLMLFTIIPLSYMVATTPFHLYPIRIALGLGAGLIFGNGFLLMSEISHPEYRNTAQGLYLTSMGLGYTVGPLLGGYAAKLYSPQASFILSSVFGLTSWILLSLVKEEKSSFKQKRDLRNIRTIINEPSVLVSGATNFLNALMFNALTFFFPIYGVEVGLDQAQIGVGFTARGIVSTIVRFPAGVITKYVKTFTLMMIGLTLSAFTIFSLSLQSALITISIIMGVQGLAYGVYLTSGNVYIAEETPPGQRGIAMAVYSMFGNLGGLIGSIILGVIAESTSSGGALRFSALATLVGLVVVYMIQRRS